MIQTLEASLEERYVVTCNFKGKPFLMSFELRRQFYYFILSSPTLQVGEDGSDTDWNMTVRLPEGLPEDFDYSEPVNIVTGEKMMMMTLTLLPSGERVGGQEGQ